MSCLYYKNNELFIEEVSLKKIANKFGTPCYIYSKAAIQTNWHAIDRAFMSVPHRICYAVKANSNIAILKILADLQSGFDIVSAGELARALKAGANPEKIIFSGVGKTATEIEKAIKCNIGCFNVESEQEIDRLQSIAAQMNKIIRIAIRVNPNVDPYTHNYISTGLKENKFGIEIDRVLPICRQLSDRRNLKLIGIACHIGSQITKLSPFSLSLDHMMTLYKQLCDEKILIEEINMGGGLGIIYRDEKTVSLSDYANGLIKKIKSLSITLLLEPGRYIVGNAGVLLTRIQYIKKTTHRNFAVIDAGLNDLLRPALYQAWQNILPVEEREGIQTHYDIAGPLCESSDFLGKNRPLVISPDDLLAIDSCGAYGFSMSSNYNSRPRPPEVLIDGKKMHLIRRRENLKDMIALEKIF